MSVEELAKKYSSFDLLTAYIIRETGIDVGEVEELAYLCYGDIDYRIEEYMNRTE